MSHCNENSELAYPVHCHVYKAFQRLIVCPGIALWMSWRDVPSGPERLGPCQRAPDAAHEGNTRERADCQDDFERHSCWLSAAKKADVLLVCRCGCREWSLLQQQCESEPFMSQSFEA